MRAADGVAGEAMTFTATVTNNGPRTGFDVTITMKVPTSPGAPAFWWTKSDQPAPSRCQAEGAPIVIQAYCAFGSLAPGDSASGTFKITPDLPGTLKSEVAATTSSDDPDPDNNSDDLTVNISHPIVSHPREVTLTLTPKPRAPPRERLRASGAVTVSDGFRICTTSAAIWVQRYRSGWRRVARIRTTSTGRYTASRLDQKGRYRAVALQNSVGPDICVSALSREVRH
jgi:hypothetical protein